MNQQPIFNYIITIHNQEDIIEQVMNSVIKCCRTNSFIYPVIDGCTDKTEEIIDDIINRNPSISINKIILKDVHEIIAINEGIKRADQNSEGFNIVLQDDVILQDYDLERKVISVYQKVGEKLGLLSFRMGANISNNIFNSTEYFQLTDEVESIYGPGMDNCSILLPGQLAFRSIIIKSPICIPTKFIRLYGPLNEALAPCFYDDFEFSIRLLMKGYQNAVLGIRYFSDIDTGGTRKKTKWDLSKYLLRNSAFLKKEYRKEIEFLIGKPQDTDTLSFDDFYSNGELEDASKKHKLNKQKLQKYYFSLLSPIGKLKYYVRAFLKTIIPSFNN